MSKRKFPRKSKYQIKNGRPVWPWALWYAPRPVALSGVLLVCTWLLPGCTGLISSATNNMASQLSQAILNHSDPATVASGAPAQMLMIDGLLRGDPDNETLLDAAATLYTAYTAGFVQEKQRARNLSAQGLAYALRALCVRRPSSCELRAARFQTFTQQMAAMEAGDVPALHTLGVSWGVWIQSHRDDLNAIAEIPRVEAIMQRIVELDESYHGGDAHIYLGILNTLLPPALGGRPERGRLHFERAVALSGGVNLMAKVAFARYYARAVFDRPLHDRLLAEVLKAEPRVEGYTLGNTLAQQQARELLASADDYF